MGVKASFVFDNQRNSVAAADKGAASCAAEGALQTQARKMTKCFGLKPTSKREFSAKAKAWWRAKVLQLVQWYVALLQQFPAKSLRALYTC